MLVKLYGAETGGQGHERKYSPSECLGARKDTITGSPDPRHISTSYTERANLTMRMSMRRFTRLTNAFSKKLTNHAHMVALYALWYNFVRIHKTLRIRRWLLRSPIGFGKLAILLTCWNLGNKLAYPDDNTSSSRPGSLARPCKGSARRSGSNCRSRI